MAVKAGKESTSVVLIAVALADEDNYWLCEPAVTRPLTPDWKSVSCRWLYPVESSLSRFVGVDGFATTDSVFTLGQEGMSRVEHFAALASDVAARRHRMGKEVFFFVAQEEVRRLDELYRQLLKREAHAGQLEAHTESTTEKPTRAPSGVERAAQPHSWQPPMEHRAATRAEDEDSASQATTANGSSSVPTFGATRHMRSHKRRVPHTGTTTHVAPESQHPFGTHASTEAFRWPRRFIAHRGSVDYLCPAPVDNTYGFRLDKVIHDGIPVFLLFGSRTCNSYTLDPPAKAVPVYQSALLEGEGGEGHAASKVLVVTRQSQVRLKHGRDDDDEDGYTDPRHRPKEVMAQVQPRMSALAEPRRESHDVELPPRRPRGRPRRVQPPEPAPPAALQAAGVNVWTDVSGHPPTAARLAERFPLALDAAVPMRTAVLGDGSCVTYTASTAARMAALAPQGRRVATKGGASYGNGVAGSGSAEDTDMRDLLSHIQLAKAQVNHTS